MARYIDADKIIIEEILLKDHEIIKANECLFVGRRNGKQIEQVKDCIKKTIENAPTEDVVPRSEVELDEIAYESLKRLYDNDTKELSDNNERLRAEVKDLEYKLIAVMHSVDKWLDGDELNQDEVNRAITMREKTLKIVEALEDERDKYKKYYFRHEYDKWEAEIKQEVTRELFEKLSTIFKKYEQLYNNEICELLLEDLGTEITELKKYIGESK